MTKYEINNTRLYIKMPKITHGLSNQIKYKSGVGKQEIAQIWREKRTDFLMYPWSNNRIISEKGYHVTEFFYDHIIGLP